MKQKLLNISKNLLLFSLDIISPRFCAGCEAPREDFCTRCRSLSKRAPRRRGVVSIWDHKDERVRNAVHHLKYRGRKSIAKIFANELANKIYKGEFENGFALLDDNNFPHKSRAVLIPVPLSKKRLRERGFNQSALIAQELKKLHPEHFEVDVDILKKIKNTETQVTQKERKRRLKNLRGAFQVNKNGALENRTIVLVDDVVTTGTTIKECREVLKRAGLIRVYALTIAG